MDPAILIEPRTVVLIFAVGFFAGTQGLAMWLRFKRRRRR